MITAMSLPFLAKKPIDLPPIVSIELIQITEKTNIPFAPKAKKTMESITNLGLNNHPLTNYLQSLFCRRK